MATRLRRGERRQANREAVLDAAVKVFRERGYQGTSLQAIAEAAGFSRGVTYSQFESKADLFVAALERRRDERSTGQRLAVDGDDPWESFIEEIVTQQLSDPEWILVTMEFRATALSDEHVAEDYRRLHAATLQELGATLEELYERSGVAPPAPPSVLATILAAMGAGAVLEATAGAPVDDVAARQALRAVLGLPRTEVPR
jgi:AcrR family transcriptional regulator